ncbi:MAG: hypothetical protein A2506_13095 [Elusimicrobia bacterium RIFOXYD12_FULL_66_9]|nr:MAG: hypothetical protein A2506_13095 [Elusimicrobia bacterium RIFOXYD12_FULL_66_9]
MGKFLVWWRYGSLRKALLAGRGALFDARSVGGRAKVSLGSRVLLNDTRYDAIRAAEGPQAWAAIEADFKAVNAALSCPRCGFRHVIRARYSSGVEGFGSAPFGSFSDRYQGLWQSSWFKLVAPVLQSSLGIRDELVCQDCGARAVPRVRLY